MNALLRLLLIVGLFAGISLNAFSAEGIYFGPPVSECEQDCGCDPGETGHQNQQKCPGLACKQCVAHPAQLIPMDRLAGGILAPQGMLAPISGATATFPEQPIFQIEKPPLI